MMDQIAQLTPQIIGLLVAMVFSAFFSGMEIAFVSSNRMRAEMDREKNGVSQKAIALFFRHPSNFVSTMLVGNNIALVIYGILYARIIDTLFFGSWPDGFRVAADTRDLNYDQYFIQGKVLTQADEAYTSHNTNRLDVDGVVKKILTTDYVREELEGRPHLVEA